MKNTSRDRSQLFPTTHKEHSWAPYGILSTLYALTGLAWFATMIATNAYSNDGDNIGQTVPVGGNNAGLGTYGGNMLQQFYSYFNFYAFRTICLFASLIVTYTADRHYLSRGAAWTSWVVNLCLMFSWLSTDLPFVYSQLTSFNDDNATVNTGQLLSMNAKYCGGAISSHWCDLTYTHAILSIITLGLITLSWMYACYQLKRARGVSNLLLTWPEVAVINFTVFGLLGYIVWNLSAINLSITRSFSIFNYLDPQQALNTYRMFVPSQIWGNYLIHGAWIFSLASTSYISFGGTTAPRMTALILNWLSFMVMFPAFLYIARHQQEEKVGACGADSMNDSLRCPSLNGVAAGLGICMGCNFMIGLVMMAVLKQVETADYAVDMYGDKALAVDAVKSTGSVPIADPHYATTRPSTPETTGRTTLTGNQIGSTPGVGYHNNNDVELGRPIVV